MRLTARVPATSANLGPGFDCLGLALDLCNEVTVDTEIEPGISWEGEGAGELPTDGTDVVSKTMRYAAELLDRELPPFALTSVNRIPLERGLGSSAAAVVAGVALGEALVGYDVDPERTRSVAASLEGHPDNVAAAIHGGLTIAYEDGVVRLEPSEDLRPTLLVPNVARLSTSVAREVLAARVPLSDASFNVGRAALAVVALTQRVELLREAVRDRLHQQQRLELLPDVKVVFGRLWEAGHAVCVSGSGPSLLVFETPDQPVPDPGEGWRVLRLSVRAAGVEIVGGERALRPTCT